MRRGRRWCASRAAAARSADEPDGDRCDHRGADRAGIAARARPGAAGRARRRGSASTRAAAAAAEHEHARRGQAERDEPVDDVALGKREPFEDRARDVLAAVRRGEAVQRAACVRPPHRRHRAGERGDERHAVGAGRRGGGERVELGVAREPEQASGPADGAAREPARVLDEVRAASDTRASRASARARASSRHRRSRAARRRPRRFRSRRSRGRARPRRRRAASRSRRRCRPRPACRGDARERLAQRAGDARRRRDARQLALGSTANAAHSSRRPRARCEVEQHRRRRVRRIDHVLAGEPRDEIARRLVPARRANAVGAQPRELRREVATDRRSGR